MVRYVTIIAVEAILHPAALFAQAICAVTRGENTLEIVCTLTDEWGTWE
jgi:hypothetical protein